MDIMASMKKSHPKRKRPAVLVRFYADDLARLNAVCAQACTPRENYCRRVIMASVNAAAIPLVKAPPGRRAGKRPA